MSIVTHTRSFPNQIFIIIIFPHIHMRHAIVIFETFMIVIMYSPTIVSDDVHDRSHNSVRYID